MAELNAGIGAALSRAFPEEVWVRGEIANLNRPPSGHVYFDLVGDGCALGVTLWASDKQVVNAVLRRAGGAVRMTDGTEVRIRVRVSWYAERGRVSLRMLSIDTAYTLGRLAEARELLLRTLQAEGLLRRQAGLTLPPVPLRVGLVTSDGSAAAHDFLRTLEGSGHAWRVTVIDTRVQGATAERSILEALDADLRRLIRRFDVVCLVRGGGARTDLAVFDREAVARAIATGTGRRLDRYRPRDRHHGRRRRRPPALPHADCVRHGARRAGHPVVRALEQHLGRHRSRRVAPSALYAKRRSTTAPDVSASCPGHALDRATRLIDASESRVRAFDPARTLARGWSITHDGDGKLGAIDRPTSPPAGTRHDRCRRRGPEHRR